MFIRLSDLELRRVEFSESYAPGTIVLGEDIEQKSALTASGHAELIEENHGGKLVVKDIRVVGEFATQVELKCARCLEPVTADLASKFDLLYRPLKAGNTGDEVSISEADTEVSFYQGEGLELEEVVKEQVLLGIPLKPLCQEDCQGLCAQCGQNLNVAACDCTVIRTDPRWDALAGIKERLKQ